MPCLCIIVVNSIDGTHIGADPFPKNVGCKMVTDQWGRVECGESQMTDTQ